MPAIDRRRFLAASSTFMAAGLVSATNPDALVAETASGRVRGVASGGSVAFLGIPYARAQRFRAPVAAEPWAGIRDCNAFGPAAMQTNAAASGPPPIILAHLPRPEGAAPPPRPLESEDCQVLNVWTASADPAARRAVMVWLHGGFFSGGSGSTVDGSILAAQHDVVVVSLNHRVNTFGFTDLTSFAGGEFVDSANAGMLDIVAALEWVQVNIASFGGDPSRVCVFGTSGGGMKSGFLMGSPRAEGLLHRAAVHSGPQLDFLTPDRAAVATEKLLAETGLDALRASDLALLPAEELLAAYHRVAAQMRPRSFTHLPCFAPVVDGRSLVRQPFAPDCDPFAARIPMIIGSNGEEMSFFMGNELEALSMDEAECAHRASRLFGDASAGVIEDYRAAMPDATPARRWLRCFSDHEIMAPTMIQARRHATAGGRCWTYRLTLESSAFEGRLGSTHTLETPLIFGNWQGNPLLASSPETAAISADMVRSWTDFAKHGDPGWGDGIRYFGIPGEDACQISRAIARFEAGS